MRYRYRLWCNDCREGWTGYGCFDGGVETSDETFDTPGEAAKEAREYTDDVAPWDYDVIDENDEEVEVGL